MAAIDVANYILELANEDDSDVSNLKLQKLVYYSQGFYLALFGEALFDEDIEAWAHGPVVPSLYHKFKEFQRNPIIIDSPEFTLNDDEMGLIEEVYEVFGQFSAWKLRNMTHEEAPWIQNEAEAGVISKTDLLEYFQTRVN